MEGRKRKKNVAKYNVVESNADDGTMRHEKDIKRCGNPLEK